MIDVDSVTGRFQLRSGHLPIVNEWRKWVAGRNRSRGRGLRLSSGGTREETSSVFMSGTRQAASFLNRSRAMTHTSQGISALRQRMIDDMRMRKLAPGTQSGYIRVVRQFTAFLGRPPDTATVEDLRRYQLHLVDHGISPVSLNAAITGLKFFFEVTLNQAELMARMQPVRVPRTLPVVLSPEEVARLIAAAGNLKHQTALSVAYGTGLRASEVVALKGGDVDSQRMTLRIEQGKGRRDRYALLSPVLLERLGGGGHCAGAHARRRGAVSRPRPHRPAHHAATEPRHPCRRRGRTH